VDSAALVKKIFVTSLVFFETSQFFTKLSGLYVYSKQGYHKKYKVQIG